MDVSNKFLAFLLVIAILVTVIGTWYSLSKVGQLTGITGLQTGYVNVTITGKTQINVTQPYCGFGSGHVTPGYAFAVLHPGNGTVGSGCHGSGDTKGNWTNT
ncbi:MAG: hypothetical protein K6T16_02115, partial [Candidatus Pacearchaeota archaeon]|nr:hypothetical protein [Candidatus Pacearchaeota archaeon]